MWYLIIEMTVYQDKLKTGMLSRKYFVFPEGIDLEIVASFLWFRSLSQGQGGREQRIRKQCRQKIRGLRGRAGARMRVRGARL